MRFAHTAAAKYWAKQKRIDSSENAGTPKAARNAQRKTPSCRQKVDSQNSRLQAAVSIKQFRFVRQYKHCHGKYA